MPADTDAKLAALWSAVDELLARATLSGILAHKLGPVAANRLRRLGEPLPPELALEERAAAICMLVSRQLLEQVRSSYEGTLVVLKGPEVARHYPGGAGRTFGDVDIMSDDATGVQRALVEQGMVETYHPATAVEAHHLHQVRGAGLTVEVHRSPHWPRVLPPPPTREILEASIPASLDVTGVLAPAPVHHALILAAHAWAHEPLWRWRDLIDIAAMSALADEHEIEWTAERWRMRRVWLTTRRTIDAALYGEPKTFPLRSWARHLDLVRDRTSFEGHLTQLMSSFWAVPLPSALAETGRALSNIFGPNKGEPWREKVRRVPDSFRKLRAPMQRPDK